MTTEKDIVDTAVAAGNFKTLAAALGAAGLVNTVQGAGPFTVFAPTDAAFAKLPAGTLENLLKPENKDQLTAILTYHVVPGKVMAADVVKLKEAKTMNGKKLTVKINGTNVMIDGAKVTATDIQASNGVIHVSTAWFFRRPRKPYRQANWVASETILGDPEMRATLGRGQARRRTTAMKIKDRPEKSKPAPFALRGSDLVPTAVKTMSERNIGSVVVVDDEMQVKGIVTERDFMRRLARQIAGPADDSAFRHHDQRSQDRSR